MSEGVTDNDDRLATDEAEQSRSVSSGDSTTMGTAVSKVCCVCGMGLAGRTRYKDSGGRYWCPACNEKDQARKEPAVCPDCSANFTKADLIEFKGTLVCHTCWERRRAALRREEARLRAVEEQMKVEEETKKRWKLIIAAFLLILALWALAYGVIWLFAKTSA